MQRGRFNIYGVLVYGPLRFRSRTLPPPPPPFSSPPPPPLTLPPVGIFWLLLFAVLIILTLDTVLFCFIPVNMSRFRPLFVRRATAVTIDRAAFIRPTCVSEPFSFIYNLCSRDFVKFALAQMYDRGNTGRLDTSARPVVFCLQSPDSRVLRLSRVAAVN